MCSAVFTALCTMHILQNVQYEMCSGQCAVDSMQLLQSVQFVVNSECYTSDVFSLQFEVCSVQCAVCCFQFISVQYAVCSVQCAMCSDQCTV